MVEKRKGFQFAELPEPINLRANSPVFLEFFQLEPVDSSLCLEWLIERCLRRVPAT